MTSNELLKFIELDEYCKTHSIYDTMKKYDISKEEIYKIQHILLKIRDNKKVKNKNKGADELRELLKGNNRITNALIRGGINNPLELLDIIYNDPNRFKKIRGIRLISLEYILECVEEYEGDKQLI